MKRSFRTGVHYLPGLLVSFIILLLLILALWLISYAYISDSTQAEALQTSQRLLLEGQSLLDEQMTSLRRLTLSMLMNDSVLSFASTATPLTDADYDRLRRCTESLPILSAYSPFIANAAIYFHSSDVILSPQISTTRSALAYDHFFAFEGMDYQQFLACLEEHLYVPALLPVHNVALRGSASGPYFTYLHTVFSRDYHQNALTAFAFIPEKELLNCFAALDAFGMSSITLLDTQGTVLCSTLDAPLPALPEGEAFCRVTLGGEPSFVLRSTSEETGFTSIVSIPLRTVLARVYALNRIFLSIFIFALMVGIVLSLVLAHLSSLPLRRIQENVRIYASTGEGPYAMSVKGLALSINSILQKNSVLSDQLDDQRQLLEISFKEHLFQTSFSNDGHLRSFMKAAHLFIEHRHYAVAVLSLDDFRQDAASPSDDVLQVYHFAVSEVLNNIAEVATFYTLDMNRVAILVGSSSDDDLHPLLTDFVQKLRAANVEGIALRFSLGISASYTALMDTPIACWEAQRALESAGLETYQVLFYDQMAVSPCIPEFDAANEARLVSAIRSGDEATAAGMVAKFLEKNLAHSACYPPSLRTQFLYDIRSTLLHTLDTLSMVGEDERKALLHEILALNPSIPDTQGPLILSIIGRMCQCVSYAREQSHSRFGESIIEYIRSQYQNDSLSLTSVADHFHLSPAYLSRLIQAQIKMSFSEYLEGLRMQTAKDSLLNTDMSIKDIVTLCGYLNSNTFFKAFKRTFGVSPSEYRRGNTMPPM